MWVLLTLAGFGNAQRASDHFNRSRHRQAFPERHTPAQVFQLGKRAELCLLPCDCRNGVHLACNIAIVLSQPLIVEASLLIVYLYSFVQWIFISLQSQYMFAADVGISRGLATQLGCR
jgi:hypothetical protein